jgi:HEAT repeat protein
MERQDVDGIAELQRAMQSLDEASRSQIISSMAPDLEIMMQDPADSKADDLATGPKPRQVRAKDAAFLLVPFADQQTREKLTKSIIGWYVKDFQGRSLTGNYSAEQIVRSLGAPAATILTEALSAKLTQQTIIKIAELISQLGTQQAKLKAGQALIEIENEMESDAFLKWISDEIEKQMVEEKEKPDPAKLQKAAELNRHNFIVDGALPAMKYLASQKAVADRLIEIASTASNDARIVERRVRALQALEGNSTKEHLKHLLSLALSSETPLAVRDYAFDRVGDIRSPEAIPPMWPLVQDAKNQRLRWRAGELVLGIGEPSVLGQFFRSLPSDRDVTYEPEELEGYASRMSQMSPLPVEVARTQLSSPYWWNRVIAIHFFERRGTKEDIARLKKLTKDDTKVQGKGWKNDDTVGKVAERTIAAMQERLK